MNASIPGFHGLGGRLLWAVVGSYSGRIERSHCERVPLSGSVLFTSNHPNSVPDVLVIGGSVPRKVSFVGTVRSLAAPRLVRPRRELSAEMQAARWEVPALVLTHAQEGSL